MKKPDLEIIAYGQGKLLVDSHTDPISLPKTCQLEIAPESEFFHFDRFCAVNIDSIKTVPKNFIELNLRDALRSFPRSLYASVSKGVEWLNWSESEKFCGYDGSALISKGEYSKICPKCGREHFPRLNPAIVVLVKRGEEVMLVHAANFKNNFMALVAGFVECGESLEECVAREVEEETGLKIKNIRYIESQAWPFPSQLMIGFTADYAGGEIEFKDGELTEAKFFTRDNIPLLPSRPSLSRKIIDMWIEKQI